MLLQHNVLHQWPKFCFNSAFLALFTNQWEKNEVRLAICSLFASVKLSGSTAILVLPCQPSILEICKAISMLSHHRFNKISGNWNLHLSFLENLLNHTACHFLPFLWHDANCQNGSLSKELWYWYYRALCTTECWRQTTSTTQSKTFHLLLLSISKTNKRRVYKTIIVTEYFRLFVSHYYDGCL